jgi:hypothetical protein
MQKRENRRAPIPLCTESQPTRHTHTHQMMMIDDQQSIYYDYIG